MRNGGYRRRHPDPERQDVRRSGWSTTKGRPDGTTTATADGVRLEPPGVLRQPGPGPGHDRLEPAQERPGQGPRGLHAGGQRPGRLRRPRPRRCCP
ncbi:MAG: hypothetical protein M0C28_38065 [Candidatus Moduliflexus flocculans]|nr:hypothetical protein [Candidatus Moduliflexus flocculans]